MKKSRFVKLFSVVVAACAAVIMALCFVGCVQSPDQAEEAAVVQAERLNLSLGGVAEAADDEYVTLSFVVDPPYVVDKTVSWSFAWADETVAWTNGKNPADYISVSPLTEDSVAVYCLAPFGAEIKVIATSNATSSVSAYCIFGYGERIDTFSLSFMGWTADPYVNPYPYGFDENFDYHDWDPMFAYYPLAPVCDETLIQNDPNAASKRALACSFVPAGSYTQEAVNKVLEYRVDVYDGFADFLANHGFTPNRGSTVLGADELDYAHILTVLTGANYWVPYVNGSTAINPVVIDNGRNAFNAAIADWGKEREEIAPRMYHDQYIDQNDFNVLNFPCFDITVTYTTEYGTVEKSFGYIFNYNHEIFNAAAVTLNAASIIF